MNTLSPTLRVLATRLNVLLFLVAAMVMPNRATAQVPTQSTTLNTAISSEELEKLPIKRDFSKLSIPTPQPTSPVLLSYGPAGYTTDIKTPTGLHTIIFTTPNKDTVEVYLPNHISKDSTFTSTIKLKPATGHASTLNDYYLAVDGQVFHLGDGAFQANVSALDVTRLVLVDKKGNGVAGVALPVSMKSDLPLTSTLPKSGTSGELIKIDCPSLGSVRPEDYVRIGGQPATILAASRGSIVILNTYDNPGLTEIEISLGGVVMKKEFRNIKLKLTADKLNLLKGESTTVHIVVSGLEKLKAPAMMSVEASGVVTMSGGNSQTLNIDPSAVAEDGTYTTAEILVANSAGTFGVKVTVTADDKK
jgi:hypothetical protein